MKQKISLFYVAIAFSIAGLCTSCSSDDPVDDTGGGTNNPGGTSSDVKQLDYGELLAFPYAEGHGRNTTGGRGGKVYHVTSLEDDASGSISGSLRWAMKQDGPKTIVFDVSGTIYLKSELKTQKDDLTIAGQTSPGGICIANYPFTINSSNIIIRFIRFRPGNSNVDCDGLGGCDKQNVIIDHCSVSWGSDECLSVYGMQNSTVQWCLAYQALRVTDVKINAATGKFASHGDVGNLRDQGAGALFGAIFYPSYLPIYDDEGNYNVFSRTPNPVSMQDINDKSEQSGYYMNFSLDVDIIKKMLSARVLYGLNKENTSRDSYIPSDIYYALQRKSRGNLGYGKRQQSTLEGTLTFQHKFGEIVDMNLMAGMGRYLDSGDGSDLSYENANDHIQGSSVGMADGPFYPTSYKYKNEKRSQFGFPLS